MQRAFGESSVKPFWPAQGERRMTRLQSARCHPSTRHLDLVRSDTIIMVPRGGPLARPHVLSTHSLEDLWTDRDRHDDESAEETLTYLDPCSWHVDSITKSIVEERGQSGHCKGMCRWVLQEIVHNICQAVRS